MSVTVPAGYVEIASLTLDATTLAAQTVDVDAGRDYFFKATGTHVLAQNPTRLADAAGYEPTAGTWSTGTHLHVRLDGVDVVDWGAHASENEYGNSYTPTADATLSAVISDSNPSDNSGSLSLTVYERVLLASFTATEQGGSAASATDAGGAADVLYVTALDITNSAIVDLSAGVSVDSDAALGQAVWAFYDSQDVLLGEDSFDEGNDVISCTFAGPSDFYTIRAGVDTNGNGYLDAESETTRVLLVQLA
jgi:hypothetical protein